MLGWFFFCLFFWRKKLNLFFYVDLILNFHRHRQHNTLLLRILVATYTALLGLRAKMRKRVLFCSHTYTHTHERFGLTHRLSTLVCFFTCHHAHMHTHKCHTARPVLPTAHRCMVREIETEKRTYEQTIGRASESNRSVKIANVKQQHAW